MSDPIWAELYVPEDSLSRESLNRLVDQLVVLRLTDWERLNRYTNYSQHLEGAYGWFEARTIAEAIDALMSKPAIVIGLNLERPAMKPDESEFWVEIYLSKSADDLIHGLASLSICMSAGWSRSNPSWFPEFLAFTRFLAELLNATYGWASFQSKSESALVTSAGVAARELQPIEWVNVYGPAYVEKIGYERLMSAPAWRVDVLANGGAMVTLSPKLEYAYWAEDRAVAEHLGAPLIRSTW